VGTGTADTWVIEPRRAGVGARLAELYAYRHLWRYFAAEALRRRYARTVLGRTWLLIRPLVPVLLGTLVFGNLLRAPSDGLPYFLFFLCGTAVWSLFELSVLWVTRSLEMHRRLLRSMYFPRILLPAASVAPALVEALVYGALLAATAGYYWLGTGRLYIVIRPRLLGALVAAALAVLLALGLGLWTSVLEVHGRDVRFTLRYVLRFWFYFTPVIYPLSFIPEAWRWLAHLNPMTPVVETFRWSLLGSGRLDLGALGIALAILGATLVSGLWLFSRAEAVAIDRL
jgi:lipopolysaccharide transport system permease protein